MLANSRVNKENHADLVLKTDPSADDGKDHKLREFGTELTNNTDASSDCNTDEKSPIGAEASEYESNVPKKSPKTHKMSDHFAGVSISARWKNKGIYKAGVDLTTLEGEELQEAVKEEMKMRKKELNKDISFQDVINFRTPELVGEYVGQCIKWMKDQEEVFKIKTDYMEATCAKKSTNRRRPTAYKPVRTDRAQAVDLVMEIHRKYGLVPETLFIAVSTIDRYLGCRKEPLRRQKDFEAIGIASLLIASKYEDIYPPALDEMIKMMNNPSTRKEVLEWEFKILKELVFQITVPTPYRFLERFSSVSIIYQNAFQLAEFIIELALYDYDIAYNLQPSEIAAVALFAAVNFDFNKNKLASKLKWSSEVSKEASIKKTKLIQYFNTYFLDLAYRAERELKVNDISIKYPQFQFVDTEPIGIFDRID